MEEGKFKSINIFDIIRTIYYGFSIFVSMVKHQCHPYILFSVLFKGVALYHIIPSFRYNKLEAIEYLQSSKYIIDLCNHMNIFQNIWKKQQEVTKTVVVNCTVFSYFFPLGIHLIIRERNQIG